MQRQAIESISQSVTLADALQAAEKILAGRVRGRIVVDVKK
jgi:hypothetical protein